MKIIQIFITFVFYFFYSSLIFFNVGHTQTIHRLNNNPGADTDFYEFQKAHDEAKNEDIIMVHGSNIHYGNAIITKQLHIIGPGYYLDQNPKTQIYPNSAQFDEVTLNKGSEGSTLTGLEITSFLKINTGNVNILKNKIYYISLSNAHNIKISQNYINYRYSYQNNRGDLIVYGGINLYGNCYSLIINNNYIYGSYSGSDVNYDFPSSIYNSGRMNAEIYNNIFAYSLKVENSTLKNNILLNGHVDCSSCVYWNNIAKGTIGFGNNNNNKNSVNVDEIFVGYPDKASYSQDGRWVLTSDSLAKGAGDDGKDCGIFGGNEPYILSGIPSVPNIYELNVPRVGVSGQNIIVNIKVKTNK
ncbi:cell surface glycoprotein [Candidatus Magnetomorum sp. HK-1]|nr:cell surface glycoprotein [Candidatus Magnetomorum sp. HK-1]